MDGRQSEVWPRFGTDDALACDFGSQIPLRASIRLGAALALTALRQ
jgi:hypothetical protein